MVHRVKLSGWMWRHRAASSMIQGHAERQDWFQKNFITSKNGPAKAQIAELTQIESPRMHRGWCPVTNARSDSSAYTSGMTGLAGDRHEPTLLGMPNMCKSVGSQVPYPT